MRKRGQRHLGHDTRRMSFFLFEWVVCASSSSFFLSLFSLSIPSLSLPSLYSSQVRSPLLPSRRVRSVSVSDMSHSLFVHTICWCCSCHQRTLCCSLRTFVSLGDHERNFTFNHWVLSLASSSSSSRKPTCISTHIFSSHHHHFPSSLPFHSFMDSKGRSTVHFARIHGWWRVRNGSGSLWDD